MPWFMSRGLSGTGATVGSEDKERPLTWQHPKCYSAKLTPQGVGFCHAASSSPSGVRGEYGSRDESLVGCRGETPCPAEQILQAVAVFRLSEGSQCPLQKKGAWRRLPPKPISLAVRQREQAFVLPLSGQCGSLHSVKVVQSATTPVGRSLCSLTRLTAFSLFGSPSFLYRFHEVRTYTQPKVERAPYGVFCKIQSLASIGKCAPIRSAHWGTFPACQEVS